MTANELKLLGFKPGVPGHTLTLPPVAPNAPSYGHRYRKVACQCGMEISFSVVQTGKAQKRALSGWIAHLEGVTADPLEVVSVGSISSARIRREYFLAPTVFPGLSEYLPQPSGGNSSYRNRWMTDALCGGGRVYNLNWIILIHKYNSKGKLVAKDIHGLFESKPAALSASRNLMDKAEMAGKKVDRELDASDPIVIPAQGTVNLLLNQIDKADSMTLTELEALIVEVDDVIRLAPILQGKRPTLSSLREKILTSPMNFGQTP